MAYLVLLDNGQVFGGHLDRERAEQQAENVEGVVIAAPIVADYRSR